MNEYIKLTLGGIVVLLLVSAGCYFWVSLDNCTGPSSIIIILY